MPGHRWTPSPTVVRAGRTVADVELSLPGGL